MNKFLTLILAAALSCISLSAQTKTYTQVDFNWSYTPGVPVCGTTLVNCYDGFQLTFTNTGAVIAAPAQLGTTALSWNWIPTGGLPFGTLNFSLAAHGYNGAGTAILSTTVATVSVTNNVTSLNGPTGLTGALQ
jgi:hypothetical protein